MPAYFVRWEIDIEADTPAEAAAEALKIMQDPDSEATAFDIFTPSKDEKHFVDLTQGTCSKF